MPDTSYQEMINVKKQFFKTDGIQCFHAVQSFVKGKIIPERAHEIGMKLAEELWGEFQVVVTTHLNTDNLHNHFVLNSISFLDGKRFCNTKKDYAIMRKTSDRLCEEYSKQITPITEEIKICNNIIQRMEKIKQDQLHEQIEKEKAQFEKEQKKNKKDTNKTR